MSGGALDRSPPPGAPTVLVAEAWPDYALLDSGAGRKLERFGRYRFVRPEPQALWTPALADAAWVADGVFTGDETEDESGGAGGAWGGAGAGGGAGRWRLAPGLPETWPLAFGELRFLARCTPFRHLGFFPDQSSQWQWLEAQIGGRTARGARAAQRRTEENCAQRRTDDTAARRQTGEGAGQKPPSVLNLFAYTGVASLVAAAAGARVTHVDASKKAIGHAVENQRLAGLEGRPIRWIVDDVLKFVRREQRRGSRYDGIILDPPKFGRGPHGEVWKLLEQLPELLSACRELLSPDPLFLVLTVYAVRCSFLALDQCMREHMPRDSGVIVSGEMAIREQSAGRLLPTAIFSRWENQGARSSPVA